MAATGPRVSLACSMRARGIGADVVLLAGDTFDCHRLPDDLIDRTAAVIAAAEIPVVLLPGNHDPVVPDAVFHRKSLRRGAKICTSSASRTTRRSYFRRSIWRSGAAPIATIPT